jgi:hypothetical protein
MLNDAEIAERAWKIDEGSTIGLPNLRMPEILDGVLRALLRTSL